MYSYHARYWQIRWSADDDSPVFACIRQCSTFSARQIGTIMPLSCYTSLRGRRLWDSTSTSSMPRWNPKSRGHAISRQYSASSSVHLPVTGATSLLFHPRLIRPAAMMQLWPASHRMQRLSTAMNSAASITFIPPRFDRISPFCWLATPELERIRFMIAPCLLAPCGLRGSKNWPAPFPGRMSYKATKPGLVWCDVMIS